ncbi:hypothetical protein XH93_39300 [Bradyrhizobium sp. CCBAU 51753]|nr:hypothetical protein XH93_39300 [Bradyrhizobium sp. CCBAU 51753]
MSNFGIATSAICGRDLSVGLAFFICSMLSISCGTATADEFKAVRERLAVSTDMTQIDIEVVGSTSQLPQFHRLIPGLVVRFRLARAYVGLYAEHEPGFEIFNIGVDLETASPMSLFETAILGPRFGKDIPGIPKLLPEEVRRRNIRMSIHSDDRAEYLRKFGEKLAGCHGDVLVENDMWVYERRADCPGLGSRTFGRVVQMDATLLTKIECEEWLPPSWARCKTAFPFEGFTVRLNFDRDLLSRWREVVSFSAAFLKSKQYPTQ